MPNPETGGALASRLRKLRENAGPGGTKLEQIPAARAAGITQPMLSKFEGGKRAPTPQQVAHICRAYNAPDDVTAELVEMAEAGRAGSIRRLVVAQDWATIQGRVRRFQTEANLVRGYTNSFPPGIFQTERAVRAVFGDHPGGRERLDGQREVLDNPQRYAVRYVLTEGAARSTQLDPTGAAEQIQRLIALDQLPNIDIGIVPLDARLPMGWPITGWEMYDERAVWASLDAGSVIITTESDVARYLDKFELVAGTALWGPEARALLATARDRYREMP